MIESAVPADSVASPPGETGDPYARRLRAELAAHQRHGNGRDAAAVRRKLQVHQLGKHIREVVAELPPLSPEDAATLRGLLPLPVPAGGGADAA